MLEQYGAVGTRTRCGLRSAVHVACAQSNMMPFSKLLGQLSGEEKLTRDE